ncbi:MAG: sugar phosphate isomerase/epimerase [Parcubacteria group bacterium]|nr:sugar phosphate isomerase/epimerase [Parcubacteria group bacterium]
MTLPISLIQGRLTPSVGREIQFFPHGLGEWKKEFELASAAGIAHIQWVCEPDNPLFGKEGQEEVRAVMERTGVTVRNMDLHELLTKTDIVDQPDELFEKICSGLVAINGGTVELPMVEASSLLPKETYEVRIAALRRFIEIAKKYNVPVAVETDLGPTALVALVEAIPGISVVYDSGNSAGMGYDMEEELAAYGEHVSNVHIKDKPVGGTTVPLGTGSVNFPRLFSLLHDMRYTGAVTLQAARGEDGKEVETITHYVNLIHEWWEAAQQS